MNKIWDEIYNQERVKKILDKLISSQKIPHALLFQGNAGVGKDFTAIKFAQALNINFSSDHADLQKINHQIEHLTEPFIKFIFPLPPEKKESGNPFEKLSKSDLENVKNELEKKINNQYYKIKLHAASTIKIESIRSIKRFLSFDYSDIKFRIILISDAHLMNEAAQNALLKSLEEPPKGVIFILTTPFPSQLRETIRSRCWIVNFSPLSNIDLTKILINNFDIKEESAKSAALFAGGSVSLALDLLEYELKQMQEKAVFVLRYSFGKRYHSALQEFSAFLSDNNADAVRILIQMIIAWLNDTQKLRFNEGVLFFEDHKITLEKFNQKFPGTQINDITAELDNLSNLIQRNINLRVIILRMIFLLSSLVSKK